jgi:hypothetical protein
MFPGAVARQHFHVAGIRRRAIEQFGRQMRTPHDFTERRVFEIGKTGTVVAFRKKHIPKSLRPGFGLQFFNDRINLPGAELLGLLVKPLFIRVNVPVHERFDPPFKRDDFF